MSKLLETDAIKHELQKCLQESQSYKHSLKKTLNHLIFLQVKKLPLDDQHECMKLLIEAAGTELLSQPVVKYAATHRVSLLPLASFRQLVTLSTLRRQLSGFQPEWALNSKKRAFQFADLLMLKRPKIFFTRRKCAEITLTYPSVIKPVDGAASRGVYLAVAPDRFKDVRSGKIYSSESELVEAMKMDLSTKRVAKDLWQAEEFIADSGTLKAARDLKFYCFYGKVGFVLEVDRENGALYCEWLPDGELANTGRYSGNAFKGNGFSEHELQLAESVSLQIPAPFIRIDFLKTNDDFVLGEFTPRPGKFDEFNNDFDSYLGQLYLTAEARLQKDLFHGKRFEYFDGITK